MKEYAQKFGHFLSGIIKPNASAADLPDGELLEKKNIVLNCVPVTPEEAIKACGKLLLESGCIEEGYIQAMLERDQSDSTAIGCHVAIPHSDSKDRRFVKKTGLAVMTYPDGIDWNGERVRLVIAIASKGEEHLEILNRVAAMAPDEESADRLTDDADLNALYAGFNGLDASKTERPLLEKKNIILNCRPMASEEAIKACGRLLVESGYATEEYIQSMLERNASSPVAIGNYVAIPHGSEQSQKFIKRTGLVMMTYPDGVQWGDRLVRLVIGIAAKGDEHLEVLDRIVEMAGTEADVDALVDHAAVDGLYKKLNGFA